MIDKGQEPTLPHPHPHPSSDASANVVVSSQKHLIGEEVETVLVKEPPIKPTRLTATKTASISTDVSAQGSEYPPSHGGPGASLVGGRRRRRRRSEKSEVNLAYHLLMTEANPIPTPAQMTGQYFPRR